MSEKKRMKDLSRREVLRWVGAGAATLPFGGVLLGCDPTSSVGADAGVTLDPDAFVPIGTDAAALGSDAVSTGGWATGGTAAMTDIASYPNPFEAIAVTACTPTCQMTLGPCHDDLAPEREDISEGERGLPMRLGLRIVDESCAPVTDANVDIWHCDVDGIYSSDTADNPPFCTGDHPEALAARWFRGHQQTDADGVAWFNTCFPGWYSGRAVHIHLTVRRTNREGTEYLTTQVAFEPAVIAEVYSTHVDYVDHGQPDTSNTTDNVFPAATVDEYELEYARMTDGAMLAWKTIVIRSALANAVCSASGSGGGGMMPRP